MTFPPKVFLFNQFAKQLHPMVNPKEEFITSNIFLSPLDHTFACEPAKAYALSGLELRFNPGCGYFLDQGKVLLTIDAEWVVAKAPLREYAEGKPVPFNVNLESKSDLFRMVPFSTWPKEPLTPTGLFLPNGTNLRLSLEGLSEGMEVEATLHAALYEAAGLPYSYPLGPREWSPRKQACI